MVEPLTLTASVIANLAFQKFLESGAGELGKKFTTEAIAAMDSLRKKLWDRLRGQSEKLAQALAQAEQGDKKALETIAKNLDVAMDDDETFATEIKTLAQQIQAGKIQDNSNMTQNVTGDNNRNIQAKAEQGGKQYIAEKMYFGVQEPD
jgi:anthranilate/para-aminobenzoate synthase component I